MAEFKDVFGFEPSEDPIVREAQQLVINARLMNIAHRVTTARNTTEDLTRLLGKNVSTSAAVRSFAGGMELVETEATVAEALLGQAIGIARAAGFSVQGKVEDIEVARIFHLETFHRPLTPPEVKSFQEVLTALAATFFLAVHNELMLSKGSDIQSHNSAMEEVSRWRAMFWEACTLAKKMGMAVGDRYEYFLPSGWQGTYMYHSEKIAFVAKAKKDGLIPS